MLVHCKINIYHFICHFKMVRISSKIPTVLNLRLKKQLVFSKKYFSKSKGALLKKPKNLKIEFLRNGKSYRRNKNSFEISALRALFSEI